MEMRHKIPSQRAISASSDDRRQPHPPHPTGARGRKAGTRGFTLVEAMVATFIFTLVMLGVYAALIKSQQLIALTRYQDNARAVLLSFADQFTRLQTTEDGTNLTRVLFTPTTAEQGTGTDLSWGSVNAQTSSTGTENLVINLGGTANAVPATVTRIVKQISPTTGADQTSPYTAAGYLLRGTFTISYSISGKSYNQSLTVVRAVP